MPSGARLGSIDTLRGLIMVVMALDHASAFVAEQHFSEFWGTPLPDYGDALSLWTRVASHLCAPGFFLLMGAGMALQASSRRAAGETENTIAKRFAVRGLVLVAVDALLVFPAFILGMLEAMMREGALAAPVMPGDGGIPYFSPGVLTALGICMCLSGLFVRFRARTTTAVAFALLIVSQLALPSSEQAEVLYSIPLRLLLVAGHTGPALISYPLFPWLAVTLVGLGVGHALSKDPQRVIRLALPVGLTVLGAFVVTRVSGGFGTHHPMPTPNWMGLFTVTKYPASLAFLMLSLGTNAILLFALDRGERLIPRVLGWIRVYGRAPLFFYVAHLYAYAAVGLLPGKTSLLGMYPVWILGVVGLYPACVWYDRFKRAHSPDSLWRLF